MEQNTQNTALLVMDMQVGILGMLPGATALLDKLAKAIATARDKNIPVIYVVVGFRQGMPEISANNKSFFAVKSRMAGVDMNEFAKVHPSIAPQQGEVTVFKRRVSAFTGSDLEVILRAYNVKHLVLTGIATGGVVLSTVREASDKDYLLTVIADCCADGDEETHNVLINKIFPRQADVVTLEDWSKA